MRRVNLALLISAALVLGCAGLMVGVFVLEPGPVVFWLSSGVLGLVALTSLMAFGFVHAMDDWC